MFHKTATERFAKRSVAVFLCGQLLPESAEKFFCGKDWADIQGKSKKIGGTGGIGKTKKLCKVFLREGINEGRGGNNSFTNQKGSGP